MKKLLFSLAILPSRSLPFYFLYLLYFLYLFYLFSLAFSSPVFALTTVTLQSDKTLVSPNETVTISLNLSSSDNTLGTDLVLTYDPTIIKPTAVTPGSAYPTYADTELTAADGNLYLSGVSDFTQGTIPSGLFATVTFTGVNPGESSIALALDPKDSSLSGVIPFDDSSSNLLTQPPTPLTITVSQPHIFVRLWNTLVSFFSFLVPR